MNPPKVWSLVDEILNEVDQMPPAALTTGMIEAAHALREHRDTHVGSIAECQQCGGPLACFCPRCRGRLGGSVTSPKKAKAVRRNRTRNARKKVEATS